MILFKDKALIKKMSKKQRFIYKTNDLLSYVATLIMTPYFVIVEVSYDWSDKLPIVGILSVIILLSNIMMHLAIIYSVFPFKLKSEI